MSSFIPLPRLSDDLLPRIPSGVSPARITRAASKQTYYTVCLFVDRGRKLNAFRAYGYFRWLDDHLDGASLSRAERMTVLARQGMIMEDCLAGIWPDDVTPEEHMLVDLIQSDPNPSGGLCAYIRHMMAVMAFDVDRRGKRSTQAELDSYTFHLAAAVTEALHYFIGHDDPTPHTAARYLAASASHIVHMLRDTFEDIAAGYYNIPVEVLPGRLIRAEDVDTDPFHGWVHSRVDLARKYFAEGKRYLAQLRNRRCRLAGYAYIARFEGTLDAIERESYHLRGSYDERKQPARVLNMIASVLVHGGFPRRQPVPIKE